MTTTAGMPLDSASIQSANFVSREIAAVRQSGSDATQLSTELERSCSCSSVLRGASSVFLSGFSLCHNPAIPPRTAEVTGGDGTVNSAVDTYSQIGGRVFMASSIDLSRILILYPFEHRSTQNGFQILIRCSDRFDVEGFNQGVEHIRG